VVRDDCPNGHYRKRKCFQRPATSCTTCAEIEKKKEAARLELERLMSEMDAAKAETAEKLADADTVLEREKFASRMHAEMHLAKEEIALKQKQADELRHKREQDQSRPVAEHKRTHQRPSAWKQKDRLPSTSAQHHPEEHDQHKCATESSTVTVLQAGGNIERTNSSTSAVSSGRGNEPIEEVLYSSEPQPGSTSPDAPIEVEEERTLSREESTELLNRIIALTAKEKWLDVARAVPAPLQQLPDEMVAHAICALQLLTQVRMGDPVRSVIEDISFLKGQTDDAPPSQALAVVRFVLFTLLNESGQHSALTAILASEYAALHEEFSELLPSVWNTSAHAVTDVPQALSRPPPQRPTTAEERWAGCKLRASRVGATDGKDQGSPSPSVDKLMEMTGLEEVKARAVDLYNRIAIAKEQGTPISSCNARFDGNPGTGKTTVGRLYGGFLIEMRIIPEKAQVFETSGSALISKGVVGLQSKLEEMKKVGGGVIFIDEAYQLNPRENAQGRPILDYMLTQCERLEGEFGSLVWILAGYKKHMDKLFEYNPGLPSRFPENFHFEDYDEEELSKIFNDILIRGGDLNVQAAGSTNATKNRTPRSDTMDRRGQSMYLRGMGFTPDGEERSDNWGNVWRWNARLSSWEDDYDNITGYGPENVGTHANPLVSRKGNVAWIHNGTQWVQKNDARITQSTYPGKSLPQPSPASRPIRVEDPKWTRIAIRRLGSQRGTLGFGNARAVRNLFDLCLKRQARRIAAERERGIHVSDLHLLQRDDLLGPRVDRDALESCQAWKQLLDLEGLSEVKSAVRMLLNLVIQNAQREEQEKPMLQVSLNRVFLGNPGTGKTTVAALYARILADLGLLSKGEVILKTASDFVGSALGTSQTQTRAILESAEGSVLVIDEAYGLNPSNRTGVSGSSNDPYKEAVIDTIVEQVQGRPGEDRAVVLLGYRKEMEDMMKCANPGLARRFQMDEAFVFSDYDDGALVRILRKKARSEGLEIDLNTAEFAIRQLERARSQPHFGNAGAVMNLLSKAKLAMQARQEALQPFQREDRLECEDFGLPASMVGGDPEDVFRGLVGCDRVLEKLREYQSTIRLAKAQGAEPRDLIEFNFVFAGSPGTGKTTVARRIGRMFNLLGLLPFDEVIEISASDLITGYMGQAGAKTREVMTGAKGKVLFIDEAYQLAQSNSYMQEVVDEIVKLLTSEELKGKLVVILAGYAADMDQMLNVNAGLRSRFSEKLFFDDFSIELCIELLQRKLEENRLTVSESATATLPDALNRLKAAPGFGNGRDIDTLAKKVYREVASTFHGRGPPIVQPEHIESAVTQLLSTRSAAPAHMQLPNRVKPTAPPLSASAHAPPPPTLSTRTMVEMTEVEDDEMQPPAPDHDEAPTAFTRALQDVLDSRGLNTKEGVRALSQQSPDSASARDIAQAIAEALKISLDEALIMLQSWQKMQANVWDELEKQEREQERARKEKRKALVPIWRCGACGRADMPYIACYVSPFIVRYEERFM
jgi:AAA+ superfamily predicted ATPase